MEERTSSIIECFRKAFVDVCKSSSTMKRGHLHFVTCLNQWFAVLVAFSTRTCSPREVAIQDLPGYDARVQCGSCGGTLFFQPKYVHEFVSGIKLPDLVYEARFDSLLSLLLIRCAQMLRWAVESCFALYHFEL